MIIASKHINLTAPTAGRGKRGFFAPGEAGQKKLYRAEHVSSWPGEPGLIFTLLSLAHAAAEIPPIFPGTGHSATVRSGHHRTTGNCKTTHRRATWAPSERNCTARARLGNSSECMEILFYGFKTDTTGMFVSTQHQPGTAATIIFTRVRKHLTKEGCFNE